MCDLTILAFDLAYKYRNPAWVLADGFIGQMMEPVEFPEPMTEFEREDWALYGDAESKKNLISSIDLVPEELEERNIRLQNKYAQVEQNEVRFEDFMTEDAEVVVMGYGIVSRMLKSVVRNLRNEGYKIGMLRPITLFPFPKKQIKALADKGVKFFVAEMSNGQMVEDVRLAVEGKVPVEFYGRMGGVVPTTAELEEQVKKLFE